MDDDRDALMLLERIGGQTLRELADDHDLSIEGARLAVVRESRRHVDKLVLDMWTAQKQGELLMLAVPAWSDAEDQRLVAQYLEWLLGEFAKRDDVTVRVGYRPTPEGSYVFVLEDVSFNPEEIER